MPLFSPAENGKVRKAMNISQETCLFEHNINTYEDRGC